MIFHLTLVLVLGTFRLLDAENLVTPSRQEVHDHHLPRIDWIRTSDARRSPGLTVWVTVNEHGVVTGEGFVDGGDEFREEALKLAKAWKYKPFERNGKTLTAVFNDYIYLYPPERPAKTEVPFPVVHDWSRLKITLERTACFGECPIYRLLILGDGTVLFQAGSLDSPAKAANVQTGRKIQHMNLEKLVSQFRNAHFFGLERAYKLNGSDLPTFTTSISIDGESMSVTDYGGLLCGMPTPVRDLEDAIDDIAQTKELLPIQAPRKPMLR